MDIEDFLEGVAERIEPTRKQKQAAQASHDFLLEKLNSGQMKNRILESYLSGSYARDTAISPIDDVDLIFVIDPEPWRSIWLWEWFDLPDPEKVLDTFAGAIRYRYEESSVRRQRRSVRLQLHHLDIDVVPAIRADGRDVINVPDRAAGTWMRSAPRRYEGFADDLDRRTSGAFKTSVRLLKKWNASLPDTATFRSYAVETMAARILSNVRPTPRSLEESLVYVFDFLAYVFGKDPVYQWSDTYEISLSHLAALFGPKIPDLGIGSNTAEGLGGDRRVRFLENAMRDRERLRKAQSARSEHNAERYLRDIFGL